MKKTFSMRFLTTMFESIPYVILGIIIGSQAPINWSFFIIFFGYVIVCNVISMLLEIQFKLKLKKT